jgi:hypothetical protein
MPFSRDQRDQEERDDLDLAGNEAAAGFRATSSVTFLKIMAALAAIGGLLILIYSLRFWASGQILRIFGGEFRAIELLST